MMSDRQTSGCHDLAGPVGSMQGSFGMKNRIRYLSNNVGSMHSAEAALDRG